MVLRKTKTVEAVLRTKVDEIAHILNLKHFVDKVKHTASSTPSKVVNTALSSLREATFECHASQMDGRSFLEEYTLGLSG